MGEIICGDSISVTRPLFQVGEGSSTLTSPHQFRVILVARRDVKEFIEKWHYSKNTNGLKSTYCFALVFEGVLYGAALLGEPATRGVKEHYGKSVVEIRRLCCVDDTPKNTESFFISKILKWLQKNTTVEVVLSYADMSYGHKGTIYKASNFKKVGIVAPSSQILWNGKLYHKRTIDNKYNGEYKPFAVKMKNALKTGEAIYKTTKEKNIFIYNLHPL